MKKNNKPDKIMKKNFAIAFSLMIIAVLSCNKDDEESDYTYSIGKIYWSDTLDTNQDGYAQFKRLHFNVYLEEQVNRTVVAEIYYRPKNASEFSFYAFSDFYDVKGDSTANDISVDIGFPNKELKRGYYDFTIELYEKGYNRLEAKCDSLQEELLSNQAFDESSRDKNYTIDISWSQIDDCDEDGFARNATMLVDIDVQDDVTKQVELYVYVKADDDSTYSLYNSYDEITISGSSPNDFVPVDIGVNHTELAENVYDFRLELYEKGSTVLLRFKDEKTDILNDRKFERQADDSYNYSVASFFWSDTVDTDMDGFTFKRKFHFDIDIDRNLSKELNAKIFFRHRDSSDYREYDSTGVFTISGSQPDDIVFQIGNAAAELDSSWYDILVSAFEITEIDTQLAISFPIAEDTIMFSMQYFETESQDSL